MSSWSARGSPGSVPATTCRPTVPAGATPSSRAATDIGGTWDLFRYPGVRSDSDMHTLGYSFKPWTSAKAIADGPSILAYLRETVAEYGIDRHIRFGHLVSTAEWSTDDARWTVTAIRGDTGETVSLTCGYLFMCSGYYSYKGGYTPEFPGIDDFEGQVVHPQQWPEDLDYAGKKVVVIGSGATAMTLVPAMADAAEHITMLQRSPTYVVSRPDQDAIANAAQGAARGARLRHHPAQEHDPAAVHLRADAARAGEVKENLLEMVRKELGADYDVDTHFTPTLQPVGPAAVPVPNSDLFKAIQSGKASVVTDTIDTFTETGIELASGDELEADIIVTATGLQMVTLGEMDFVVDGDAGRLLEDVDLQGLRLLRRPEPGVVVRLHQRLVDAARRPDLRVRLPPAQPHGRDRHRPVHAPPAPVRRGHARARRGSTTSRPATCSG